MHVSYPVVSNISNTYHIDIDHNAADHNEQIAMRQTRMTKTTKTTKTICR